MRILKTDILFIDEEKQDMGFEDIFFWEKGAIVLDQVNTFCVFVHKNKPYPYTEVYLNSGNQFVVSFSFSSFLAIMNEFAQSKITQ